MPQKAYYQIVMAFGTLASIGLVFNMGAMQIYWEQLFVIHYRQIDSLGVLILIGFLLILIFNIASILWGMQRIFTLRNAKTFDVFLLVFGVLCVLFMLGEKAMIDEIGREEWIGANRSAQLEGEKATIDEIGQDTTGEWMILYGFLMFQGVFNILFLRRLQRAFCGEKTDAPPILLDAAP
ncbi:MAG: hypothetical protein AB1656_26420 [Candidatus Omnitrophota bacterium]